ncbi:MAG: hypothetical protein SNJ71_08480, partial [Bacteroidales bacterium]
MDSYLWNTGDTSRTININKSGTYSLTVTKNGCRNSDTVHIILHYITKVDLGNDTVICTGDSILINPGTGFDSFLWNTGDTTSKIWVSQAGTYTVYVTSRVCSYTDSITIATYPLPKVSIQTTPNQNYICQGDTILLFSSGFTKYQWSTHTHGNSLLVTNQGYYSLTVTDKNNCQNSDNIYIRVQPLPSPTIQIFPPSKQVCFGDTITLQTQNFPAIYWSTKNFSPIEKISSVGTHNISVMVMDEYKCINFAQTTVTVYPNPKFSIYSSNTSGIACKGESIR